MSDSTDQIITTKDLIGKKVFIQKKKLKKLGKVRHFIFHPHQRCIIGFTVKRPDAALMFHRNDTFVALGGYDVSEEGIILHDDPEATDRRALEALDVKWQDCLLWTGMPVLTEAEEALGYVGTVSFDRNTGAVASMEVNAGSANDLVVGRRVIPARMICGFKTGVGEVLAPMGSSGSETDESDNPDEVLRGAIVVSNEARSLPTEGGVAEAAGGMTAVAVDKAKKAIGGAREAFDDAKPGIDKAAKQAEATVNKGAYAAGKHLSKAPGMFGAFKDEFQKAMSDSDEGAAGATVDAQSDDAAVLSDSAHDDEAMETVRRVTKTTKIVDGKKVVSTRTTTFKRPKGSDVSPPAADVAPVEPKAVSDGGQQQGQSRSNSGTATTADDLAVKAGKHLASVPGMFSQFRDEYQKALGEDDFGDDD